MKESLEIIAVHTREDALQVLATQSIRAICLNIISMIPGVGLSFIQELNRGSNPVPVVILTAAIRKEAEPTILYNTGQHPSNIFAMIAQPASPESLLNTVTAAINRSVRPAPDGNDSQSLSSGPAGKQTA